jgi:hypothetical protein
MTIASTYGETPVAAPARPAMGAAGIGSHAPRHVPSDLASGAGRTLAARTFAATGAAGSPGVGHLTTASDADAGWTDAGAVDSSGDGDWAAASELPASEPMRTRDAMDRTDLGCMRTSDRA